MGTTTPLGLGGDFFVTRMLTREVFASCWPKTSFDVRVIFTVSVFFIVMYPCRCGDTTQNWGHIKKISRLFASDLCPNFKSLSASMIYEPFSCDVEL